MPAQPPHLPPLPRTYLMPRRRRLSARVWATTGVVFASALALFAAGYVRVASPGRLAEDHLLVGGQCAACHEPWRGVTESRCLRCHDREDTRRLTTAAHINTGRGHQIDAVRTDPVAC